MKTYGDHFAFAVFAINHGWRIVHVDPPAVQWRDIPFINGEGLCRTFADSFSPFDDGPLGIADDVIPRRNIQKFSSFFRKLDAEIRNRSVAIRDITANINSSL